MDQELLQTANQ